MLFVGNILQLQPISGSAAFENIIQNHSYTNKVALHLLTFGEILSLYDKFTINEHKKIKSII